MKALRLTAIALLALLVSSCASPEPLSTVAAGEDHSVLPQHLGLEHAASSYLEVPGAGFTHHYGGTVEGTSLVLVDDAVDIHGVDVIKVGTGDDWSTVNFVTYLTADESGVERINYRNLGALQ